MDFRFRGFAQFNEAVTLFSWKKVICMNLIELGIHAVDAPDALNKARGIPWNIVINDNIGAIEVDTFGEDFGSDEDTVIVFGPVRPGIEVDNYILADTLERFAGEEQDLGSTSSRIFPAR